MLIKNRNNFQNKHITFTSRPIHYLNLTRVKNGLEKGFVKVCFSKLDLKKDKEAIEILKKSSVNQNLHFQCCCTNFLNPKPAREKYYAIELIGNETLDKRIVGLAECYHKKNSQLEVSLLATKSEFLKENPSRTLKNIGISLLSSIFQIAKKTKSTEVKIPSGNDEFYSNVYDTSQTKYTKDKGLHIFYVANDQFDNFISFYNKTLSLDFNHKKLWFSRFRLNA